eukprot:TRINITY_DN4531_c0_g2_i1.p1 TRINITY_DN4531_c0_g2~~TRINITY_DN4531_c0_g2_i1.p1  ORF type:complete len:326 (+),score=7.29 TRINITY_DN4531_c0_g2_i1:49-1026(+)
MNFAWKAVIWIGSAVLILVRMFLDSRLIARGVRWWWASERDAQDGRPVADGVEVSEVSYGTGWRETAYLLKDRRGCSGKVILYVHGGGWGAANATTLIHSMTPFVRRGYTVVAVNYPLAPTHPFPHAVVSIVKSLAFFNKEYGYTSIHLHGDSAGGNLTTLTAAFISNPSLLRQISDVSLLDLPDIMTVTSLYGLLDDGSWWSPVPGVPWLEAKICSFLYSVSIGVYKGSRADKVTITDYLPFIKNLPPSLLIAGARDPLVHSSSSLHWNLRSKGLPSHFYAVKGARHAFFGLPPDFFSGLLPAQQYTIQQVVKFMEKYEPRCLL